VDDWCRRSAGWIPSTLVILTVLLIDGRPLTSLLPDCCTAIVTRTASQQCRFLLAFDSEVPDEKVKDDVMVKVEWQ
jgi:hypothetical protein